MTYMLEIHVNHCLQRLPHLDKQGKNNVCVSVGNSLSNESYEQYGFSQPINLQNVNMCLHIAILKSPVWKIMKRYCCMFLYVFSLSACLLSPNQGAWESEI